jgi:DNA adenine methylase
MRIALENIYAIDLILQEDTPRTLFYLDPPYLPGTVTVQGGYGILMTRDQHVELLDTVLAVKGKVMLSGYNSDLYNEKLIGWIRHEISVTNSEASGSNKGRRIECIWVNY